MGITEKNKEIFKTLGQYKKTLEDIGYEVLYIGLYGSQNYNLDDELSDVDVKAIILPSLHDIIFRKVTSTTIECETGNIDVKDLITFYDVIKKGNFSYIEAINTEYSIGDKKIKEMFKPFKPNLKSILGAMYEKRKALTHEYPSKHEEFEKWGYDPKQHHHILRLYDLLEYNLLHSELNSYLTYDDGLRRKELLDFKRNKGNVAKDIIESDSDEIIEKAQNLIDYNYIYKYENIDKEINKYIEDNIKIEITNSREFMSARQYRTFNNSIPKKDLEKFPILRQYNGQDVSYIVYESVEIL